MMLGWRIFDRVSIALVAVALACTALPVRAAEIDPEADAILRQMSDHLAGLKAFSVTNDVSTELILRNGFTVDGDKRTARMDASSVNLAGEKPASCSLFSIGQDTA